MRLAALVGLVALVAGCGPHYWVWRDAQPSPSGWVAARAEANGAVVAVRPDDLREAAVRQDGASYVGRRGRRPKRFIAGVALVALAIPLVIVSLNFGIDSIGQNTPDGATSRTIAIVFGALAGAASVTGVSLLSWAWPPRPAEEPIAAHPELVTAPPPLDAPAAVHP